MYMYDKSRLFSALPLKNLLLSVFYYFLTEASSVVCYVQQALYKQSNSYVSKAAEATSSHRFF